MVERNFLTGEITLKIVYYGPPFSGKRSNIQKIYKQIPRSQIQTNIIQNNHTISTVISPVDLATIEGMNCNLRLMAFDAQASSDERALSLLNADGVIFVADRQSRRLADNIKYYNELEQNFIKLGIFYTPLVVQWNKTDLDTAMSKKDLETRVNYLQAISHESTASNGEGVIPTLEICVHQVIDHIYSQLSVGVGV